MLNVCKVCKTVKTTQNPVRHCFVPVPDRFSIPLHLKEAATRACLQMRVVWLNMIFIRNLLIFLWWFHEKVLPEIGANIPDLNCNFT